MQDFEKLGVFYLGREYDMATRATRPDLLLYNSRDLTTHAVCVGMTGSGKTGLCLALLEEAAIDGIPAIAIDPKGDIGNLLLTFPELKPEDFAPWIDPAEAQRHGSSQEELAAKTAASWREGLAAWGEDGTRIKRLQDAADMAIYTPGSNAGLPLTVLKSFAAPPAALLQDADALRERISATASGLLALMGIEADPIRSREHILVSNVLDHAWRQSQSLDMAALLRQIQKPPFDKVGFVDLETFFPAKDRFSLAMSLNNLLASPAFAGWMTGEPLDIGRLFYTAAGKPRLSIISIAHLPDSERMFFVTILLNELLAWVRTQPATSSLRALLYMDEVFGYFPPTANPPSKTPMLTLLKQARAFGVGMVLATQNPVDLDYKGLSNCGTWFLGRLQTERDKARMLDGLEGATASAGASFDRQRLSDIISGLGNRVFLMNNVHDDHPVVFQTRWTLSYLRGPLTRDQIHTLMKARKAGDAPPTGEPCSSKTSSAAASPAALAMASEAPADGPTTTNGAARALSSTDAARPVLPPGIPEVFLAATVPLKKGQHLEYRPALLGSAKIHFVAAKQRLDEWRRRTALATLGDDSSGDAWSDAQLGDDDPPEMPPESDARFASLPAELASAKNYARYATALKNHLYSADALTLFNCKSRTEVSRPEESEAEFRARLSQQAREERDAKVDRLRAGYASKLAAIHEQIRKAEQRVQTEKSQVTQQTWQTVISVGSAVLGAVLGRKMASQENIRRAGTAVRAGSRIAQQQSDVGRAEETVAAQQAKADALEAQLNDEVTALDASVRADSFVLEEIRVSPRKADVSVERVALAWTPWHIDAGGRAEPAFSLPAK